LSAAAAGCVLSCLIGLDISRTGSFAFPLIFAALAALSPHCGTAGVHETKLGSKDSQPSHPARNRPTRTGKSATFRKKTVSAEKIDTKTAPLTANRLVRPVSLAALVSLFSTNLEVLAGMVFQPCWSTPLWLLQTLSSCFEQSGSLSQAGLADSIWLGQSSPTTRLVPDAQIDGQNIEPVLASVVRLDQHTVIDQNPHQNPSGMKK